MVVDGYYRIGLFLAKRTYHVVGAFLHFGVGALHGIQLDAAAVSSGIYGRNGASAQTDAIIVSADDHHLVSCFGFTLQAVALCAVAHTAGQHDDLVVSIRFVILFVFKSQHGTAD